MTWEISDPDILSGLGGTVAAWFAENSRLSDSKPTGKTLE